MSGPIVRSGPSPEFSKNWDSVFGKKTSSAKAASKPTTAAAKPSAGKSTKASAKAATKQASGNQPAKSKKKRGK